MDKEPKQKKITELANNILNDLKHLSGVLKPVSVPLYEANNAILNELLIAKDTQTLKLISKVLSHCLKIAQYKNFATNSLSITSKTLLSIKSYDCLNGSQEEKELLVQSLCQVIDVVCLLSVQKPSNDLPLRIVQTMFSLIDMHLMKFLGGNLLTRMYSVFFDECKSSELLKNICVSALFALTECLFGYGNIEQSFEILQSFLNWLFKDKKYSWIKGKEMRGLIWDLIIVGVKNFTANHIIQLEKKEQLKSELGKMYELSLQYIFLKKKKNFYNTALENHKSLNDLLEISAFVRYFKAYVVISISLSIQAMKVVDREYVKFRETVPKLIFICDLERNSRMFIFLEAICQILLYQYVQVYINQDLPLSLEKGIVLLEILSKISEELCLCNESITVAWDNNQYILDKICHEEPKINDGDFIRLIKNTIFQLRVKYQKDEDLLNCKTDIKNSSRVISERMGTNKKWEIFIKYIIKTIRYLSSNNFMMKQHEEDPTRKIVLQLQYWFLICPSYRAKNMILQELLVTSNQLTNKMQAVKVSQCVQIGSNIMYGYYEDLDSLGLTIILKMMAGVKADWEEGKSFEELDQIYNLAISIFKEAQFFKSQKGFSMTIQALVQCANGLIADLEQPKQKILITNSPPSKRQYKMIDYIMDKLLLVVCNNIIFAAAEWNFITAFFITLCSSKNIEIKKKGINEIGVLVNDILKSKGEVYGEKKEQDIMGLYLELSKSHIKEIELNIIEQLKGIMPRIEEQSALMDGFRIAKIFSESEQEKRQMISGIHELQEILIKECLFRIVDRKYLKLILDGLQVKFAEKNEEYRLINLFWNIADHFRQVTMQSQNPQDFLDLWESLFKSIWTISEISKSSQTKQSAIHSLTQILAESSSVLTLDFIISMITKYFHPMVILLVGIHPSSFIESQKISETSKIALKNTMKIFRKLISIPEKNQQQKIEITKNILGINSEIAAYINNNTKNKQEGNLSVELLLEISNYVLNMTEDEVFSEYGLHENLKEVFIAIEQFLQMCTEQADQIQNKKIELNSHLFKKKLKPCLQKLQSKYTKQIVAEQQH